MRYEVANLLAEMRVLAVGEDLSIVAIWFEQLSELLDEIGRG